MSVHINKLEIIISLKVSLNEQLQFTAATNDALRSIRVALYILPPTCVANIQQGCACVNER